MTLQDCYDLAPLKNLGAISVFFARPLQYMKTEVRAKDKRGQRVNSYATHRRSSMVSQHSYSPNNSSR